LFSFEENCCGIRYRLFGEVYDEHVPSQKTCEQWFQHFKIGDFDVADKEHGKPLKKYEDVELQALLNEDAKHKNNFYSQNN